MQNLALHFHIYSLIAMFKLLLCFLASYVKRKAYGAEIRGARAHIGDTFYKLSLHQEDGATTYCVKFTKPILSQQTHQV